MKSFYDLLKEYGESEYYPYHMPGHKRRCNGFLPQELIGADITEIDDFDNLHDAKGLILALEERAAKLYDSEETFYLVNGSTAGILSAISASVSQNGHIIMARNCHKSAYHGAYLRGLQVTYIYPDLVPGFSIADGIRAAQVKEAMEKDPQAEAVLIVSPTYEGRISEVQKIAKLVHEKGKILIVDEAHGAHLGLAKGFSDNSISAGADLVIHSVHKTLPSLTQTALIHVNGERVDRDRLRRFLAIYQSSSPSYLLMAGIDSAVRLLTTQGETLFADFEKRYRKMLRDLSVCKVLDVLPPKKNRQDIGKLVIFTGRAGVTGKELADLLRKHYKLQLEMSAGDYALAMFTIGDDEEGYRRMTEALLELDQLLAGICEEQNNKDEQSSKEKVTQEKDAYKEKKNGISSGLTASKGGQAAIQLREAWDMEKAYVPLEQTVGRYVGEFVNLYPPGTPILVPGEVMTQELLERIRDYLKKNFEVQGIKQMDKQYYIACLKDAEK